MLHFVHQLLVNFAVWWWAGSVQWVPQRFFIDNCCLLLKTRSVRAVGVHQKVKSCVKNTLKHSTELRGTAELHILL